MTLYEEGTKETADLLADIIHRVMCFRGQTTKTCRSDKGDGLLFARELDRLNLRLVVKERKGE